MSAGTELCMSCGDAIEPDADVCPTCGSKQKEPDISETDASTHDPLGQKTRQIAERSKFGVPLIGLLLPPLGYYLVGRTKTAIICLATVNFLLVGQLIAPIHTYLIIRSAQKEVEKHG